MSGDDSTNEDSGIELSRRTFTKAAGAAAGAGLLGASAGTAAGETNPEMAARFANPRVQELVKVWERGYRGRPDRTIGLTDSGIDARHPDLGPWNGVKAEEVDDGDGTRLQYIDSPTREELIRTTSEDSFEVVEENVGPIDQDGDSDLVMLEFETSFSQDHVDAELSWDPNEVSAEGETQSVNDLALRLDVENDDGQWEQVAIASTARHPERLKRVKLGTGVDTYRLVAVLTSQSATYNTLSTISLTGRHYDLYYSKPAANFKLSGDDIDFAGAKTVGWADAGRRYGDLDKPRDTDGHGSHCASIMGGSGRASQVARFVAESDEQQQLTPFTTITQEVTLSEDEGGVYASAYGDNLEIEIFDQDADEVVGSSEIGSDTSEYDNNVAEASGSPGTEYEVTIKPADNENTDTVAQGVRSAGRVDSYNVGALADPATTDGDRTGDDDQVALHSGVAPNASLLGLQGLSEPVGLLARNAGQFSANFNLRSVNMSWGYVGGLPLGVTGNVFTDIVGGIRTMADNGILTVAAAGNAATPANGNGAPANADEAISVVATGPRDGIVGYSSGGIGANDEDGDGPYMKPDVTAPGGSLTDLVTAAKADTTEANFDEDTEPSDYTGKSGTSMAAPFTNGVAGLVADAMEDAGLIDAPADAGMTDVMKLKQVVLATASETAFTAAPYHRGKAPTYQQGGRDPYEGYGRVNPDAAIDAVRHELFSDVDLSSVDPGAERTIELEKFPEKIGLDVPQDSRATAGYIEVPRGELTLNLGAGDLQGGDATMASGGHVVDFFVYDPESPGANGEPSIVAQGQSQNGSTTTLTLDTTSGALEVGRDQTRRLMVVAKLVNVPGAVNGFDIRTDPRAYGSFVADELPLFEATGGRADDGDRFVAGTTNNVSVTLESVEVTSGEIRDRVPEEWELNDGEDIEQVYTSPEGYDVVSLGTFDLDRDDELPIEREYSAVAPNEAGSYQFGPARVFVDDEDSDAQGTQTTDTPDDSEEDYRKNRKLGTAVTFGPSDPRNLVVGEPSTDSATTSTDSATDTVDDTSTDSTTSDDDSVTDTVSDTVDDTL
jgi:subtilisin family serine protease